MLYFIAGKWTISKQPQLKLTEYIILRQINLYREMTILIFYEVLVITFQY